MTRFKFCMIGTPQSPILEMEARNVAELHHWIARARYIEGRMVEIAGEATDCPVLIPANRIQIVMELPE
ncbi:hypothetical protein [Sphingomonas sp.]|uniref:hypothetical protein n=1 Tax=Sphingomonas sp. TaxID=28214 RepID=UPI0038AF9A67